MTDVATPDAQPDTTTERWMYLGRRTTSKGAIGHAWRTPSGDSLYLKQLAPASIGSVYEVTMLSDGRFYTGGAHAPRYVEQADLGSEERLQLTAKDREAAVFRDRKSAMAKAAKINPLQRELDALARASAGMTRPQRRALAVELMEALGL